MATVTVVTIVQHASLGPGETKHHWWNNAPYGKVFVLEVLPIAAGTTQTGFDHVYEVEITRQWRKYITKESPGSIGVNVTTELEIHYEVKNVGTKKIEYTVKMAVIG
jgi:hypothetical protein